MKQEAKVVIGLLRPRHVARDAKPLWRVQDGVGGFEHKDVGALAKAREEDFLLGLCFFQRCGQPQERMCRPCITNLGPEGVRHGFRSNASLFGEAFGDAAHGYGNDRHVDVSAGQVEPRQSVLDRAAEKLGVALLPDPSAFPAIVETRA